MKLLLGYGIRGKKSVGYGILTNIVGYRLPGLLCIWDTRFGPLGYANIHWDTGYHANMSGSPLINETNRRTQGLTQDHREHDMRVSMLGPGGNPHG